MKRFLLPLAAIATAALLLPAGVRPAYACSTGPDYDPLAESDVIVSGRITGWELIENVTRWDPKTETEPYDDPNYYGPYDPIRVGMTVTRVYKGSVPAEIELVAGNTLLVREEHGTPRYDWVGSYGACGAFDFDPTGKYFVMGLNVDRYGRYHPSRLRVFFIGEYPPESYDHPRLSHLLPLLPGTLPSSGGPPPETASSSPDIPVPALAALGLTLLAGGSALGLYAQRKA